MNYKGVEVGFYRADLWVNGYVIVELKKWQGPTSPMTSRSYSTNSKQPA